MGQFCVQLTLLRNITHLLSKNLSPKNNFTFSMRTLSRKPANYKEWTKHHKKLISICKTIINIKWNITFKAKIWSMLSTYSWGEMYLIGYSRERVVIRIMGHGLWCWTFLSILQNSLLKTLNLCQSQKTTYSFRLDKLNFLKKLGHINFTPKI